ncbi:MAG: PDZ domain-containing protein [Ruminococcus sp.]|nr:PDZ domain-containing protein [Ruminococcus sp.]
MGLVLSMDINNKVINRFLCLCASAAVGAGGMYLYNKKHSSSSSGGGDYKLISECESVLKENGVDLPENADAESAALKGYLSVYKDEYLDYTSPVDAEAEYVDNINKFACLITCGYKVARNDSGELEVKEVEDGSVAEKQGLQVGDIILAVDEKSVESNGIKNTSFELLGKDGTVMHLKLKRGGEETSLDFTRALDDTIDNDEVSAELKGDVLKMNIRSVSNFTSANVNGYLTKYNGKFKKMIFDLRDNVGGSMDTAISVADMFVGEGYITRFYNDGREEKIVTATEGTDINVPTVVLVNDMTASAAELITAVLKQYGSNVTIVGTKTYGKAAFQDSADLSNGGTLIYTVGYCTIGEWDSYDGKGISPDVEVKMDKELKNTDKDIQLKKALDILG